MEEAPEREGERKGKRALNLICATDRPWTPRRSQPRERREGGGVIYPAFSRLGFLAVLLEGGREQRERVRFSSFLSIRPRCAEDGIGRKEHDVFILSLTLFLLRTEEERATHTRLAQVWLTQRKGVSLKFRAVAWPSSVLSQDWERPNFSLEWTLRTRSLAPSLSEDCQESESRECRIYNAPSFPPPSLSLGWLPLSVHGRSVDGAN